MLLNLTVGPKIEWFLKSQLLISRLLQKDIEWDDLNDSPQLNDAIHKKSIYVHNRCFCIGNSQIVVQDYGIRHYNNRCGAVHSYIISSSELVLLLETK